MSEPANLASPITTENPHPLEHAEGFDIDPTQDDSVDSKLAEIEMAGEEVAIGWKHAAGADFEGGRR